MDIYISYINMNYEVNTIYNFPIIREESKGDVITLGIDTGEGIRKLTIDKFAFQKSDEYKLPETLGCRVKAISADGIPTELAHSIPQYVRQLYLHSYQYSQSVDFEITDVPTNPEQFPYRMRDKYGLYYNLTEKEDILTRGQHVRCKFITLLSDRFTLKRISDGGTFTFETPEQMLMHAGVDPETTAFIIKNILPMKEFASVRYELMREKGIWALSAIQTVYKNLRDWFLKLSLTRHNKRLIALVDACKKFGLYMLEGSSYLNALPSERRRLLQRQLTELLEGLRPYSKTLELVANRCSDAFVEGLFDKLYRSGYLYHPSGQLATLMLIFREFPDKVSSYVNRIFESLFARDLENWRREPFRSAFVEQLEIYINQARHDIDNLPLAESREQKSDIETIIKAIALQLLLAGDDAKEEDKRRNWSLFYRYIALLRPTQATDLLTKSFLAIAGGNLNDRLKYNYLREPMLLMSQATVIPTTNLKDLIRGRRRYVGNNVEILISSDGISVSPAVKTDVNSRVIPEGLMTWLNPQVYIDGIKSLATSKFRKIAEHNSWWGQIETGLFQTTHREAADADSFLRDPMLNEECYIVIDDLAYIAGNDPVFNCHVQHEGLNEVKGTIRRSDIVGYFLKIYGTNAFRAPNGSKMGFPARVTGRREDTGMYMFSLQDRVKEFIHENFNYLDSYTAVVASSTQEGYNGISSDGVGVILYYDGDSYFEPGDIVYFRRTEDRSPMKRDGQLFGLITGRGDREAESFNKDEAFGRLLAAIGEIDESAENNSNEDGFIDDVDEILIPGDISEIVETIRMRVLVESDLITAYDYLRYARLLALAIRDNDTAEKLRTHARLLGLHQYFAINRRVDTDQLEELRAVSEADPLLRIIFHRLELVSWLGQCRYNDQLFATANDQNVNELESSLARMVLSYNLLLSHSENADNELAVSLKNKIMEKLKVNAEIRTGKYFGSESKYIEFKTSLVFPAVNRGEAMRENPAEQQQHILTRIAGLLNASGGTLYLGVNNDGYAVGLGEDFRYYERKQVSDGVHMHSIRNIDNLCVFLENLVHNAFGATVARKINIAPDPDNEPGKEVIQIQVEESLVPVLIDGKLFVRQSGQSTREYHEADAKEFMEERRRLERERNHLALIEMQEKALDKTNTPEPSPAENVSKEQEITAQPEAVTAEVTEENTDAVPTSKWRPNVLHSHEEDFVQPMCYLYFSDSAVEVSHYDEYFDTNPDCTLALAVPESLSDGYLILVYEGELGVRVQLSELLASGQRRFNLAPHHKLKFAALAAKDDLLIYIYSDSKETLWRRAIKVEDIDGGQISSIPRHLFETAPMRGYAWEIVDSSSREQIEDCVIENLTGQRHGVSMRVHTYDSRLEEYMDSLITKCSPAQ